MNTEAQRIAIAEACGWKSQKWGNKPHEISWITPQQTYGECPNYLTDLNAMHEAEKVLDFTPQITYALHLGRFGNMTDFSLLHATAAQRAEAFLRTLNLWKD